MGTREENVVAVIKWVGGSSNSFEDPNNWSPAVAPAPHDDAVVEPAGNTSITTAGDKVNTLTTSARVSLSLLGGAEFTIYSRPDTFSPMGTSANEGTIVAGDGSKLSLLDGILTNTGEIRQLANADLLIGDTRTVPTVVNAAGAVYDLSGPADIKTGTAAGSSFTNDGTITRTGIDTSDLTVTFINHGNVSVGSGNMAFLGSISNTGTMTASGSGTQLMISQDITGKGSIDLDNGGTAVLGSRADDQTIDYLSSGTLALGAPGMFLGTIAGFFTFGDKIDLINTLATSASYSGSASGDVLTVDNAGVAVARLNFSGTFARSNFAVATGTAGR
jgi:hypothetical protein